MPILLALLLVLPTAAQKKEKPKVHADFQFGSYPSSRTGTALMANEQARLLLVGYHEGWQLDKVAKTFKLTVTDLAKVSDELEDQKLGGRVNDFDVRPFLLVVREPEFDRLKPSIELHTQELLKVLQDNWTSIENMVTALPGAKRIPSGQLMYETVVSGILLGGLMDAFYEDKTMMVGPPRRSRTEGYYAWLVESNPAAAGSIVREIRESDRYRIVTVGKVFAEEKLNVGDLRGNATVYDDDDARRYRTFINVLTRDKFIPYFKSRRSDFLKIAPLVKASKYTAFAGFFAWYYNTIVNRTVDALVAAKKITPPEKYYTYAIRAPQ
jgi:hypothetical protein